MELGDQSRTALKRQAAAKKKASKAKKARRKYRKLDEDRASASELPAEDEEGRIDDNELGEDVAVGNGIYDEHVQKAKERNTRIP